jgi:hypothetical protein
MIVNGPRPTSVPPPPENNPSALGADESVDATGFPSLLFSILAAPQPALQAAAMEEDGGGNISASEAAGDDKASPKLLAGNVAAVNGAKSSDEKYGGPCVARSKGDSAPLTDPTTGITSSKIVTPGVFSQPDNNSREIISASTSDRVRSGANPGEPVHLGPAIGEEADLFSGLEDKLSEHSQPRSLKPVLHGQVSQLLGSPDDAEFSVNGSDGVDSELIMGPKFHFEDRAISDSAEAEMRSFAADPKERELPEIGRDPTQLPSGAGNPMTKATLPHEGTAAAPHAPTSTWRPTIERLTGEIVGHIQMNKREAILHLEPPELGQIKIDLQLKGDKLQAHIFTEAHEAQSLIEHHIQELRQALQANNLDLVDVRVQSGWHGATGDATHSFPQQQQSAGQQEWSWASGNIADAEVAESQPSNTSTRDEGRVSMWA